MNRSDAPPDKEDADDAARFELHQNNSAPPLSGLRAYSTQTLHAEIARRRNARITRGPITKCELCEHFLFADPSSSSAINEKYNPCTKTHKMSFRAPDQDDGPPDTNDDWGYYRPCCNDYLWRIPARFAQKR